MKNKELYTFIMLPVVVSLIMITMYFSGIHVLQQIIAPVIEHVGSGRELGLLEQVEHVLLLMIIWILVKTALQTKDGIDNVCFMLAAAFFVLLFLEEVDYGVHWHQFIYGAESDMVVRNFHNIKNKDGKEYVDYLKLISAGVTFVWFVVLPLFKGWISSPWLKRLIPSKWFILGIVLSFVVSRVAHYFEDNGYALINGVEGALNGNISEFREAFLYYLFYLYALQVIDARPLFRNTH